MSDKPEDAAAAAAAAAGADKGGKGGDKGAGKGAGKKKDKKKKDGGAGSQRVPEPEYIQERIQIFDRLYAEYQEELKKKESKPITITLPDGKTVDGKSWVTTPQDIVSGISQGLAKETVISKVNGELWDLPRVLEGDCTIEFLKFDNPEAQAVFWHSSAHVLGEAMELKYGGCLCYGPPIENGFYYDIHLDDKSVAHEDYSDLEQLANKGIKEKQPFLRLEMKKEDLLEMFKYNEFKHRIINERITTPTTTVYRCGPLIDLCRGPHVPDTGRIKAFAVTKNSSAYWEGNADAEVLQRVYGISFPDKKLMKEWKVLQEEAAKRDHRKIGRDQGLFFFHELSPGSCFFYPRGAFIYNTLIEFMKGEYRRRGFQEVITPNIFNSKLWETSGHWEHYSDDMFHVPVEKETFALKPMNCPGHCLLFGSTSHSYRELPLRFADFGVLHRNELSGALHGLTRVRRFQQDDAHIFCMESQIEEEIKGCLDFLKFVYGTFGFTFQLNLSTRPKKFLGEPETWDRAEKALENALNSFGQEWFLNAGDGAFYGPKIDITISDALKRKHQCATIQLDFQLPQRFELQYMAGGSTGGENDYARPVIVHRAILGSVERMIAILTESFGGKWPFWLSPRQACVIPVRPQLDGYAEKVRQFLHDKGFMVEVDVDTGTTLNKKIRNAQLAQFNFILVVGNEEEDNNTVNVRTRDNEVHGQVSLEEMAVRMEELRVSRALTNNFGPAKASEGSAAAEPAAAAGGAAAAAAAGPSGVRATTI